MFLYIFKLPYLRFYTRRRHDVTLVLMRGFRGMTDQIGESDHNFATGFSIDTILRYMSYIIILLFSYQFFFAVCTDRFHVWFKNSAFGSMRVILRILGRKGRKVYCAIFTTNGK